MLVSSTVPATVSYQALESVSVFLPDDEFDQGVHRLDKTLACRDIDVVVGTTDASTTRRVSSSGLNQCLLVYSTVSAIVS